MKELMVSAYILNKTSLTKSLFTEILQFFSTKLKLGVLTNFLLKQFVIYYCFFENFKPLPKQGNCDIETLIKTYKTNK